MSTPSSGNALTAPLRELGRAGIFLLTVLARLRLGPAQLGELLRQVYFAGVRSLVIIVISGFFVGLVLTLQTYDTLTRFGASDAVSTVLALSLFRELFLVLSFLFFTVPVVMSINAVVAV